MKKYLLPIILCLSLSVDAHAEHFTVSNPANAGSKEYVNPIIYADYSDPDVVASPDGSVFYMTASSFQCAPGLPILKSTDLVNWNMVNYALESVPPTDYYAAAPQHGKGVWAPCIKYHNGEYYIYWGDPDYGIFMVKTDNPEAEWSEPVLVKAGKGMIDPSPFWDEDGRAYLSNAWAGSRAGFNSIITVSEMSPDGTRLISNPRIVFDGNDGVNHTIEGTKLYKRNGRYYIFAPAGGVSQGWQLVMRSRNIYGPYEPKIVMAQGDSDINGPHQGGWVTTATGEDWFVHFQDRDAYGRIIHLNPMKWDGDWPVIGVDKDGDGTGTPVRKHLRPDTGNKPLSEQSPAQKSLLYQWHANYNNMFGFPMPDGGMRLYGHKLSPEFVNLWEVPNLWLQKFPAEEFTFSTQVKISAKKRSGEVSSGIIVMGLDYCRLGLTKRGDNFMLQAATCTNAEKGGKETVEDIATISPQRIYNAGTRANMECEMYFKVTVTAGGICKFAYSTDGKKYIPLDITFKAREGKWIGAKVGFYSITPATCSDRGWIDIISDDIKVVN